MLALTFTVRFLLATGGAIPPSPVVPIMPRTVVDSEPLLTGDALTRMTTFWMHFAHEPDSVQALARNANQDTPAPYQRKIPVFIFTTQIQIPVVNMTALAATYPSVAADFKTVGMTPEQWELYRNALDDAWIGSTLPDQTGDEPTYARNKAFLIVHQRQLDALKATGMPLPDIKIGLAQDDTAGQPLFRE